MLERTLAQTRRRPWLFLIVLDSALTLEISADHPPSPVWAQEKAHGGGHESEAEGPSISGRLLDSLGEPVHSAEVWAQVNGNDEQAVHTESQKDGIFLLDLPPGESKTVVVGVSRSHFEPLKLPLDPEDVARLDTCESVRLDDVELVLTEMEHLGEFLVALACERAAAPGVEAETCLRHGPLIKALESAARKEGADCIAFGRPAGPESSFSLADLDRLAAPIKAATGLETHIL